MWDVLHKVLSWKLPAPLSRHPTCAGEREMWNVAGGPHAAKELPNREVLVRAPVHVVHMLRLCALHAARLVERDSCRATVVREAEPKLSSSHHSTV